MKAAAAMRTVQTPDRMAGVRIERLVQLPRVPCSALARALWESSTIPTARSRGVHESTHQGMLQEQGSAELRCKLWVIEA